MSSADAAGVERLLAASRTFDVIEHLVARLADDLPGLLLLRTEFAEQPGGGPQQGIDLLSSAG